MSQSNLEALQALGVALRKAASVMAVASTDQKNEALLAIAENLRSHEQEILHANQKDMDNAKKAHMDAAKLDRLALTPERLGQMIAGINIIAAKPDPVGAVIKQWRGDNGLLFSQVRTPIGVLAIIYESRPNVTIDAGALCLKSGNGVLLRGGSDSFHSTRALHHCLQAGLRKAGLPIEAAALVPSVDRALVGAILSGLEGTIDMVIPRGGRSLVERVQKEARVPVLGHLEGICHGVIAAEADLEKAVALTLNAKMRRPGICGALETLLVERTIAPSHLPPIAKALQEAGCALRGDEEARTLINDISPATEEDWYKEYLAPILAIRIVDDLDAAIEHIRTYGSGHTEMIVTENKQHADYFLSRVDSAIVIHNASTQFADGGEFGFGGEIGISTSHLHARGPVGLEGLTCFKYQVRGEGHTRA